MRCSLPLFILVVSTLPCRSDNYPICLKDSSLNVHLKGKVLLANAGFAPLPAFSFNSPIAIGFLTIQKGKFKYEPDFALGLNGKPWMANNWFRYMLVENKRINLNAGINPFLFYDNQKMDSGDEVIHTQRNLTVEVATEISLNGKLNLNLFYRHNNGWDGALSGHFFDLSATAHELHVLEWMTMNIKPELFYFNFTGTLDGFFGSLSITFKHHKLPLSIYGQGVLPLWAGFAGTSFKYNTGIAYEF